ncbi:MAG: AAA family ATPase [Planctomycetota bacterium]
MAKRKVDKAVKAVAAAATSGGPGGPGSELQRPSAEILHADELSRLADHDGDAPRPPGWKLTPKSVIAFVLGDEQLGIAPKFVGRRSLIECCVVALATNRGLMLIGEPGTAKSWLSELLAAAISGDSTLTIQGSAGTTEDAIRYSWNYALLLAEGPSRKALVPAPLWNGMTDGKLVRFEEITRCPIEIQDNLLSIMSDRVMHVPELTGEDAATYARHGFNVIATANTRDRGVNEMSAALKRRFNFETVPPIDSLSRELELVQRETDRLLQRAGIPIVMPEDKTELLVTTFHELRNGKTADGKAIEPPSTVMSTAEAVSTAFAAALHAYYYNDGEITAAHLVQNMVGSALKDSGDDLRKLRHYFDHVVKPRKGPLWKAFYQAREELL